MKKKLKMEDLSPQDRAFVEVMTDIVVDATLNHVRNHSKRCRCYKDEKVILKRHSKNCVACGHLSKML